jgi:hypothetical protein
MPLPNQSHQPPFAGNGDVRGNRWVRQFGRVGPNGRARGSRNGWLPLLLGLVCLAIGCRAFSSDPSPNLRGQAPVQNPMIIPMMDRWLVMDQVSNEIDDYFKIYREERIRVLEGIMSEGWIETRPKISGTIVEPWKKDSMRGFERLHATLQTVRRFAKVRVIPSGNSYQIDVQVFKELEDLQQPVGATARGQLRFDNSIDRNQNNPWLKKQVEGWIPMGRDIPLEQQILRNIQQRLSGVADDGLSFDRH